MGTGTAAADAVPYVATLAVSGGDDDIEKRLPLLIQRLDGASPGSAAIATGKARTAAVFRRATKAMEDSVNGGRFAFVAAPDVVPLEGGLPIVVDGDVVGGIGTSGVTSAQDAMIGQAGIDALLAG